MDPISATGLALGIASLGLQIYTGCIQGVQMLITALDFPEDCKYLNLRLRMEQQRLFAWSETSGLLDLDAQNQKKVLESNTFILHRTTVLDLLVQVQCLFKEFEEMQRKNGLLRPAPEEDDDVLAQPEKDAAAANFPLPERRRNFIKKVMSKLKEGSKEGYQRLKWVSFDKEAFEALLSRFSLLNDNMTDILDARLQVEIHHTVQDTNRGVLQLHHQITDLGRLVMALTIKLSSDKPINLSEMSRAQRAANEDELAQLSKLAKFKAFNESIGAKRPPKVDEATAAFLELGDARQRRDLVLDKSEVEFDEPAGADADEDEDAPRCEAFLLSRDGGARKRVWVEWKDYYDWDAKLDGAPSKEALVERVHKLAALLNHSPKPEAFRTLHCLGFFDLADPRDADKRHQRLGLVFERPADAALHAHLPPVSLRDLMATARRPRVTDRARLAHAVARCLHHLHAVNWLHKGLGPHSVVFFRGAGGAVDYARPYLSGFDFSRPARDSEFTEMGGAGAEARLYRHPSAQSPDPGERPRFRRAFDVYALGVLLVEIAHWRPVWEVLGIDLPRLRAKPGLAFGVKRALLAPERVEELGANMGEVFEAAARRCIEGPCGEGGKGGYHEDGFYEEVVMKLGEIRV